MVGECGRGEVKEGEEEEGGGVSVFGRRERRWSLGECQLSCVVGLFTPLTAHPLPNTRLTKFPKTAITVYLRTRCPLLYLYAVLRSDN